MFFVRSREQVYSPCCDSEMEVIGSRKRVLFNDEGEQKMLRVRRLSCLVCGRIHHELPDIIVPYKRFDSASIEAGIEGAALLSVTADDSTIYRWRRWFIAVAWQLYSILSALAFRLGRPVEVFPETSQSLFLYFRKFTGTGPGWLARVVRPVVNTNNWPQTRSAFLSD